MPQSCNLRNLIALTADDPEFKAELVGSYLSNFELFPAEFASLIRSGNEATLRFSIHRIKASVRMIEADELERVLEGSPGILGQPTAVEQAIGRVETLCRLLTAQIRRELSV